jgi:hypothetical protein
MRKGVLSLKIAFWSPKAGQTGTTSNLLAIAVATALTTNKNIYLTQFHFADQSMENALLGTEVSGDMFENIGLDSFVRNLKIAELNQETIHNASLSFLGHRLNLLPGTTKENEPLFVSGISQVLTTVIHAIDKQCDIVFMDAPPGKNEVAEKILEEADCIIVNLKQSKVLLRSYFLEYHLPEEKVMYVIGSYHADSRYNLKNMVRSFRALHNKTAVIPFNIDFMDAIADGKVLNYMVKNKIHCKKECNVLLMKEIEKAVDIIMKRYEDGGETV